MSSQGERGELERKGLGGKKTHDNPRHEKAPRPISIRTCCVPELSSPQENSKGRRWSQQARQPAVHRSSWVRFPSASLRNGAEKSLRRLARSVIGAALFLNHGPHTALRGSTPLPPAPRRPASATGHWPCGKVPLVLFPARVSEAGDGERLTNEVATWPFSPMAGPGCGKSDSAR